MLSGEGNAGERLKTTTGLIRKTQLCTCITLFWYISLPLFCTVKFKLPETSEFYVLWRKCRTCSRSLFFHCSSFSPCIGGRYHFSFCHLHYKMFMLFFQQKSVSFVFLALALDLWRPFSRWASLACQLIFSFSLSFSCSIFKICGHDN